MSLPWHHRGDRVVASTPPDCERIVAPTIGNIVFYADDPDRLSRFWAGVFGYPHITWDGSLKQAMLDAGLSEEELSHRGLAEDPQHNGPRFFFHHADGPKQGRNRMHIDVQTVADRRPSRDELDAEKDRLVALGAQAVRLVDQPWGAMHECYYQMLDPEGNEFCLQ